MILFISPCELQVFYTWRSFEFLHFFPICWLLVIFPSSKSLLIAFTVFVSSPSGLSCCRKLRVLRSRLACAVTPRLLTVDSPTDVSSGVDQQSWEQLRDSTDTVSLFRLLSQFSVSVPSVFRLFRPPPSFFSFGDVSSVPFQMSSESLY